jgi:hypothetical protein
MDLVRPCVAQDPKPLAAADDMVPILVMHATRVVAKINVVHELTNIRVGVWARHAGISSVGELVMATGPAERTVDYQHGGISKLANSMRIGIGSGTLFVYGAAGRESIKCESAVQLMRHSVGQSMGVDPT